MAQELQAARPPSDAKLSKRKRQPKGDRGAEGRAAERPKSLRWRESLPEEDPFSLLAGGDEGGFLSLEEIDELDYEFIGGIPEPPQRNKASSSSAKSKKRKHGTGGDDAAGSDDNSVVEDCGEGRKAGKKKPRKKKKAKSKKEKEKDESKEASSVENPEGPGNMDRSLVSDGSEIINIEDHDNREFVFQNDEYRAWKKLKLHPMLMKSIRRLGFKEPTPIQKACIPAAVQEGKDVIGAAETGSGKTLAFGLPIMHFLLKECDKAAKLHREDQDGVQEVPSGSPLQALILAPTRELALQVSDHLKEIAKLTNISVVPIVGGMSTEKQERLLKKRPEIIVGTPGRLWEFMSAGEKHLVELDSLSFFVLDEADRMIENGHFNELQSIIDMLPSNRSSVEPSSKVAESCNAVPSSVLKKRQTFVFSATIALSDNFRKKLKRGYLKPKSVSLDGLSSIERLSERAGMRADVAIIDLTNASIVADKLEESFIECIEENKEAYLYYILSVHGHGRTIVFCTSIAALRRISSILRILDIRVWTLHAQMQQRARLKAIDRFRDNDNGVLVATDVAARGLDIPGVRTVIHYQLPHSAEVYIHRSGRTARASSDGCCIALISPTDRAKFFSLCKSLSKESLRKFPLVESYMPEVMNRLSLARQIDKISRKNSQELEKMPSRPFDVSSRPFDFVPAIHIILAKTPSRGGGEGGFRRWQRRRGGIPAAAAAARGVSGGGGSGVGPLPRGGAILFFLSSAAAQNRGPDAPPPLLLTRWRPRTGGRSPPPLPLPEAEESVKRSWFERNTETVELMAEESGSEEERMQSNKQKKISSLHLKKLQQELSSHLAKPLQPRTLSHSFLAGAGLSPLLQQQLEELSKHKQEESMTPRDNKMTRLVVIGQDCVEPLQALRSSGQEFLSFIYDPFSSFAMNMSIPFFAYFSPFRAGEREQRRKEKRKLKQVFNYIGVKNEPAHLSMDASCTKLNVFA
ncbi:hypothetical protein Taro_006686 [Colocasia esculenta]|uniref:ATP-dependent RNA helicase n=1 Tax=Colocasia esculenta TaxID=4460 RepID=A0A843TXM7_COLES|nr:hypothetical protein [Colocasia esculenta]